MTIFQQVKSIILDELGKVDDYRSENWSDMKWKIITTTMNIINKDKCVASQSTVSDFYDRVFYEYINA